MNKLPVVLRRRAALPLAVIVATGSWLAYYDYRAFGSPTTLPYTVDRAEYAMAPYYVWQSQRPEPVYRHAAMRAVMRRGHLIEAAALRSMLDGVRAEVGKNAATTGR